MIARTLSGIASQQVSMLWMACAGLLIFACFFAGVLVWTSRKSRKELYQSLSRVPFDAEVKR